MGSSDLKRGIHDRDYQWLRRHYKGVSLPGRKQRNSYANLSTGGTKMLICGITASAVAETDVPSQGPQPLHREEWCRFKEQTGCGKSATEQPKHSL